MRTEVASAALAVLCTLGGSMLHAQVSATYDFEGVALGTSTPFSTVNNGITATFSASATQFLVDNFGTTFAPGIADRAIYQPSGTGPLTIAFSSPLSVFAAAVGTNGVSTVTLNAFLGTSAVGTSLVTTSAVSGFAFPGGPLNFTGTTFDRVVLTSGSPTVEFIIDNISVRTPASTVPEPSTYALLATGLVALGAALRRRP